MPIHRRMPSESSIWYHNLLNCDITKFAFGIDLLFVILFPVCLFYLHFKSVYRTPLCFDPSTSLVFVSPSIIVWYWFSSIRRSAHFLWPCLSQSFSLLFRWLAWPAVTGNWRNGQCSSNFWLDIDCELWMCCCAAYMLCHYEYQAVNLIIWIDRHLTVHHITCSCSCHRECDRRLISREIK
jgi:hypothetical protein